MRGNEHLKLQIARWVAELAIVLCPMFMAVSNVHAQQVASVKAGMIPYLQGEVFLDNKLLQLPKGGYAQLENGQSLSTQQGRVELLLSLHAYLRLGENGSLRLQKNKVNDIQLELEQGSALIEVVQEIKRNRIQVRISTSIVEIEKAGLYRLDCGSGELRVYGGAALVDSGDRKTAIERGEMVHLDGNLASAKFDPDVSDPLHQWAARRSFDLFAVSQNTRKQRHWMPLSSGWVRNSNYRMSFYSELFYRQWIRDQAAQNYEELLASLKSQIKTMAATETRSRAEAQESEATLRELLAKLQEAARAVQAAEEQIKQVQPSATQAKPDAGP